MLKKLYENSFFRFRSKSPKRDFEKPERALFPSAKSQSLMEREMSLQTLARPSKGQSALLRSAPAILAFRINKGLSAFIVRFMTALYESRLRQANQVIRQYQHLIDRSNDWTGNP